MCICLTSISVVIFLHIWAWSYMNRLFSIASFSRRTFPSRSFKSTKLFFTILYNRTAELEFSNWTYRGELGSRRSCSLHTSWLPISVIYDAYSFWTSLSYLSEATNILFIRWYVPHNRWIVHERLGHLALRRAPRSSASISA